MNSEVILGQEMNLRKDALVIAAQFLEANPDVKLSGISVPNGGSYNVVPRECKLELLVPADFDYSDMETQMEEILLDGMSADFKLSKKPEGVRPLNKNVVDSAVHIIVECEKIAVEMARKARGAVRSTIGKFSVNENGSIELGIDQRRLDNDLAECMKERIKGLISFTLASDDDIPEDNIVLALATPLSARVADIMRRAYRDLFDNKEPLEMGSMPGQDASKVIRSKKSGEFVDGGMIFVRSLNGGVSHHPEELSSMDDAQKACDLLFETVNRL